MDSYAPMVEEHLHAALWDVAGSRWPVLRLLAALPAHVRRHGFEHDFTRAELAGTSACLPHPFRASDSASESCDVCSTLPNPNAVQSGFCTAEAWTTELCPLR